MKKYLFFAILGCLGFVPAGHAQNTFAPVGAEWWYNGNNWDYMFFFWETVVNETWTDHLVVTGDTTIQGVNCRKVTATRTKKTGANPDSSFVALNATMYFYDNTDTVFYFNNGPGRFDPLYVLNVTEGDTVCLRNPYPTSLADSTFCYVVDSIRMAVYDTTHLKTCYTRTLAGPGMYSVNWGMGRYNPDISGWVNKGQYTERLGGTFGKTVGFFPAMTFHNPDAGVNITFPSGYLSCYIDPVTHIKRSASGCDVPDNPHTSVGAVAQSPYGLTVYPNPSVGRFTLTAAKAMPQAMDIQVTDLNGRVMATTMLPAGKTRLDLDLEYVNTGIYLLVLQNEGQRYYQKLVISK